MGTRFILGRAGSGKTHFLHEELVRFVLADRLTASVLLIVPKQSTFTAERAIATDPRLGGFVNVRVIAPDDLGELALVETGASVGARLDPVGRGLILSHLLRTHSRELIHFGQSATQPGMAAQIDSAFSEFEHAGRNLCDIDDLLTSANSSNDTLQQSLGRKLQDLCTLYKLYQQYLTDHGFDAFNRQALAPQAIEDCPLFQRSLVLVDDFYEFTAYERLLIASIAKTAPQTLISMLVDPASPIVHNIHHLPADTEVLSRPELTYRKLHFELLKAGVTVDPPLVLKAHLRFTSDDLKAVEASFLMPAGKPIASSGAVQRIVATDYSDEVDAAAREIKSLLTLGYRLREICVLARSIEDYEPLINGSFAEHDIAYFVDKRRQAEHHPLVRTLGAIGMIVQSRWALEPVIELLRAGLAGVGPADVDLLDDYVRQHNVPPAEWQKDAPWTFHRPSNDEESAGARSQFTPSEIDRVNTTRVLVRKALADVGTSDWSSSKKPIRQCVTDVFRVLDALKVRPALLALVKTAENQDRVQDRDEHLQVWTRVTELADQIVDLLGDVEVTGQEFAQLLLQTLAELDLAITPPTIDQVLVGSVERTRTGAPRAVILLGMNAGQFPKSIQEQAVLNDRDRHALNQSGVEVRPASRQAILEERFLGYLALTRASDRLTLIRIASDAQGNELEPSPFWRDIDRAIAGSPIATPTGTIGRIATPRQLISHTLRWARVPRPETQSTETEALYDWLTRASDERITMVRDRAWPVLRYANAPKLSKTISLRLFGTKLEASVSRFESFAACPFQHFARYGLRLQQSPDSDITALDLGSLYHTVLERLVRKAIEEKIDFAKSDQLTPVQIREIAQKVGEQLRNQVFLSSARNRYTLDRLEMVVHRLIRAQQFAADKGVFRPGFAELTFGKSGQLPPLTLQTPGGNSVVLSGKIDRVDIDLARSQYTVIDYKLAGEQLSLGYVAHGLMLQLLTYLLVLDAHGETLTGAKLTPAAALYVRLLRSIDSTKDPASDPEPETPEFHAKHKPRGLINFSGADDLDTSFTTTGQSEVYAMRLKKDGTLYDNTDAVETEQFQQLVTYVHDKIVNLADQIIEGNIAVAPYLIGGDTPCGYCPYPRVCRLDRLINEYRVLPRLSRKEALEEINQGGAS